MLLNRTIDSQRPTRLSKNLRRDLVVARHVFLVAAPVGIIVGAAVAGYDYIVNTLLWDRFSLHKMPSRSRMIPVRYRSALCRSAWNSLAPRDNWSSSSATKRDT